MAESKRNTPVKGYYTPVKGYYTPVKGYYTPVKKRITPVKRNSLSGQISKRIGDAFAFGALALRSSIHRGMYFLISDRSKKSVEVDNHPMLAALPFEVLTKVFECCSSVDVLTRLALTSNKMHANVRHYIQTSTFQNRFCRIANSLGEASRSSVIFFESIGSLIKACHTFNSKQATIDFLINFFIEVQNKMTVDKGWAFLFSKAMGAAADPLRHGQGLLFSFIEQFLLRVGLVKKAFEVLSSPVKLHAQELRLREVLIGCFLYGQQQGIQLSFHLSALVRLLSPPQMEHRILMILGAPIRDGIVDYESVSNEVIDDATMLEEVLGDMPQLLDALLITKHVTVERVRWSDLQIFNLMEIVTTYPEPWVLTNFTALILRCPRLARLAIYTRACHGSVTEAGETLYSCVESALRLDMDPNTMLHLATQEVSTKCSVDICVTIFRECIRNAHQRFLEVLAEPVADRGSIDNIVEVNKHTLVIFENMLHFMFQ